MSTGIHRVASGARPLLKNLPAAQAHAHTLRAKLPRRCVELLDAGVLSDLSLSEGGKLNAPILQRMIEACPPGESRHETVTAFNVLLRHLHVARKCCTTCLYPRSRCVCARLPRVSMRAARVWVFQHFGEYGRANNSGSLLCLIAGARRALRGISEQQDELLRDVLEAHERGAACVLFPAAGALDAREFVARRQLERKPDADEMVMVVLDGTGRQARNLERFMPQEIPRIKLPERHVLSWLNPVRGQTQMNRVCTAQAAAVVLDVVGERDAAKAIEDAVRVVVEDNVRDRAVHNILKR